MQEKQIALLNTTALAFMGDAVFEAHVREHLLEKGQVHADKLHREAVVFVRAEAQAFFIKTLLEELSEEELALVKRARNRKSASKPKNADPVDYKWATAFEALIGYLYLNRKAERLLEIMEKAISLGELHGRKEGQL